MKITIKNIVTMAFMACALQSSTHCWAFIFKNEATYPVIFRLKYFSSLRTPDNFHLKAGGAWRLDTGVKLASVVEVFDENNKMLTSKSINSATDYGIFFRDINGQRTLESYNKDVTRDTYGLQWGSPIFG